MIYLRKLLDMFFLSMVPSVISFLLMTQFMGYITWLLSCILSAFIFWAGNTLLIRRFTRDIKSPARYYAVWLPTFAVYAAGGALCLWQDWMYPFTWIYFHTRIIQILTMPVNEVQTWISYTISMAVFLALILGGRPLFYSLYQKEQLKKAAEESGSRRSSSRRSGSSGSEESNGEHRRHHHSSDGEHRHHHHSSDGEHRHHHHSSDGEHRHHHHSSDGEHRRHHHSSDGEHRHHHSSDGEHRRHHHSSDGEHRHHHHSSDGEHRHHHHSSDGEHRHHHHSSDGEHRHHHHSSDGDEKLYSMRYYKKMEKRGENFSSSSKQKIGRQKSSGKKTTNRVRDFILERGSYAFYQSLYEKVEIGSDAWPIIKSYLKRKLHLSGGLRTRK